MSDQLNVDTLRKDGRFFVAVDVMEEILKSEFTPSEKLILSRIYHFLDYWIDELPTNTNIAKWTGLSRKTVSHSMTKFKDEGIISFKKNSRHNVEGYTRGPAWDEKIRGIKPVEKKAEAKKETEPTNGTWFSEIDQDELERLLNQ